MADNRAHAHPCTQTRARTGTRVTHTQRQSCEFREREEASAKPIMKLLLEKTFNSTPATHEFTFVVTVLKTNAPQRIGIANIESLTTKRPVEAVHQVESKTWGFRGTPLRENLTVVGMVDQDLAGSPSCFHGYSRNCQNLPNSSALF